MWRSLKELGGIDNSYARKALAAEKEIWESQKEQELAIPDQSIAEATEGAPEDELSPSSDEAYIETPRCTTCEECIKINKRMFAYDDNKQAYITDLNAGSYKQLVEAAENCQVAIIHPGQPVNSQEANLKELISRAELFF